MPKKMWCAGLEKGKSCGKMDQMKSEAIPRTGIVDALGAGLTEAARRPWLWIVPIVVDLILWLAPRLSITQVTTQAISAWRALLSLVYAPDQVAAVREPRAQDGDSERRGNRLERVTHRPVPGSC